MNWMEYGRFGVPLLKVICKRLYLHKYFAGEKLLICATSTGWNMAGSVLYCLPLFLQLPRTNASHYFLTSRLTYILPALLQIKGSPWKPEFTLACRLCQQLDISCASNKRHTWYSCTYSFPEIENQSINLIRELHRLPGQHGRQFEKFSLTFHSLAADLKFVKKFT